MSARQLNIKHALLVFCHVAVSFFSLDLFHHRATTIAKATATAHAIRDEKFPVDITQDIRCEMLLNPAHIINAPAGRVGAERQGNSGKRQAFEKEIFIFAIKWALNNVALGLRRGQHKLLLVANHVQESVAHNGQEALPGSESPSQRWGQRFAD